MLKGVGSQVNSQSCLKENKNSANQDIKSHNQGKRPNTAYIRA